MTDARTSSSLYMRKMGKATGAIVGCLILLASPAVGLADLSSGPFEADGERYHRLRALPAPDVCPVSHAEAFGPPAGWDEGAPRRGGLALPRTGPTARYLLSHPQVADDIEEGVDKLFDGTDLMDTGEY